MKCFIKKGFILILSAGLFHFCTNPEEPDLYEQLSLELVATDVTAFQGTDGSIILNVTGGVPPYIFNWSNGESSKDIYDLTAGIYTVTVRDAVDSTATESIEINQPVPENIVMDVEGNIYTTVKIGEQIWMQQNLRVSVAPDSTEIASLVYGNNPDNEETYGRLYSWNAAMNGSTAEKAQGICPVGWHIPSDGEWKELEIYLGMTQQEADITNNWRGAGIGYKLKQGGESGYEAVYAGRYIGNGRYDLLNQYEYIWTSTEFGDNAWRRCLRSGVGTVGRWNTFPKSYGFSVRCIKD